MKKIDTSAITTTVGMPIKSGTLLHLQQAYQEALTAIGNNMIGVKNDTTNYYILYGCVNTGTGLNYIISAGAIYYNGEVFLVAATTFTAAAGQVAVCNFSTTYASGTNADPVLFTDAVSRNVHQIRTITITAGASGSGAIDFTGFRQTVLGTQNIQLATLPAAYTISFEQNKSIFVPSGGATVSTTISFDLTNAMVGNVVRLKWTYGAGLTLTINQGASQTVIRDSGSLAAVASANNLLYVTYLGTNEAGNGEISYTLKQF